MDGYHFSREQLAAMPDPHVAIHRRGAAFTFDAENFCRLVQKLHEPITEDASIVYAPSFDHAVKDPVADTIAISPSSRILIFEGNYISLDREPWKSAARLMDERWFVNIDKTTARERLIKRHVASGIVLDEEAAHHRIDSTDFLNADDVLQNRLEVHEEIPGDS
jgi:pantothenate kinase